jgi:hypothetical protein
MSSENTTSVDCPFNCGIGNASTRTEAEPPLGWSVFLSLNRPEPGHDFLGARRTGAGDALVGEPSVRYGDSRPSCFGPRALH